MQASDLRKGSAIAEAALVIPIVFLVICSLINISLNYYKRVYDESKNSADKYCEEDVLRVKWQAK